MKRSIAILVLLLVLPVVALADIDLSGMSFNELVALADQINLTIWNSQEWQEVTVPQGVWEVGKDIPEGHWTIKPVKGVYSYVSYGDTLENNQKEVSYKSENYYHEIIMDPSCSIYKEGESMLQVDIDAKEGSYIEIEQGDVVFSPYSGKPSFEFYNGSSTIKAETTPSPTPLPVDEDGYTIFEFSKAARYPDEYSGTKVSIKGRAVQVIGDKKSGYNIRLATNGTIDDIVYIFTNASSVIPDAKILDDDNILVKAIMYGEHTYESVSGAKITLPLAYAHSIEILNTY